jgi:hypothetical protein
MSGNESATSPDGQHQEGARARCEVWSQASAEQYSEEGWPWGRPSSFLAPVGIGLLGFLKQFIRSALPKGNA